MLIYEDRRSNGLRFRFRPDIAFPRVREAIGAVSVPALSAPMELLAFVTLELLANSFRAQQERGVEDPVILEYMTADRRFLFSVTDAGRGFNPRLLPYDLESSPEDIDPTSEGFAIYRERYDNLRCGMGLLAAKRVFGDFRLLFLDKEGEPVPWYSGCVKGTFISGSIPLARR